MPGRERVAVTYVADGKVGMLSVRSSPSRLFVWTPCVLLALSSSSVALLFATPRVSGYARIMPGVTVAGVDVGGSTAAEALDAVYARAAQELDREVTVTQGDHSFEVTLRDLGGRADVRAAIREALAVGRRTNVGPSIKEAAAAALSTHSIDLPINFDPVVLRATVSSIADAVRAEPVSARIEIAGGELKIVPHKTGLYPDVNATMDEIRTSERAGGWGQVELVAREVEPEVVTHDLEDLTLVSTFSTTFSTGQVNRASNIRLAASLIDGTVVAPGGVFSLNQTTGPRTTEIGFLVAPVYSGHDVIMGVGGGVCQIATTIYNAAVGADMKIVERHQHSLPVHYVPWGRDATVSYGAADLRFQNVGEGPVVVRVTVEGGTLTAAVLGHKPPAPAA